MDMAVFFSTFGIIFLAELGDKTQLTAMALATKHPWKKIFIGIALAFALLKPQPAGAGQRNCQNNAECRGIPVPPDCRPRGIFSQKSFRQLVRLKIGLGEHVEAAVGKGLLGDLDIIDHQRHGGSAARPHQQGVGLNDIHFSLQKCGADDQQRLARGGAAARTLAHVHRGFEVPDVDSHPRKIAVWAASALTNGS